MDVVALPLEGRVRLDRDLDQGIAGRTLVSPRLALAAEPQDLSVAGPRRNGHLELRPVREPHLPRRTIDRIEKVHRQRVADIEAAARPGGACPRGAAENLRQDVLALEIGEAGIARIGMGSCHVVGKVAIIALPRPLGARFIDLAAVEPGPLLGIAEKIIGGRHLLELFLGRLVAGVEVGMELLGKLAVGLLDVVLRGVLADAQETVGVGTQSILLSIFLPLALHRRPRTGSVARGCPDPRRRPRRGIACREALHQSFVNVVNGFTRGNPHVPLRRRSLSYHGANDIRPAELERDRS
jgi:hypothetical protein